MQSHSLILADLPYLEEAATKNCLAGFADAYTAAYTGPGVAVAIAYATASGQTALTRTRTHAAVRETPRFTLSWAFAWASATSFDGDRFSHDRSFSASFHLAPRQSFAAPFNA